MKIDQLPNPQKYWKAPPGRERGDQNDVETYAAVGGFLTVWERLEDHFARLFVVLVQGSWAAKRSYGSIMSNSGRRNALRAAGEIFFELKKGKIEETGQLHRPKRGRLAKPYADPAGLLYCVSEAQHRGGSSLAGLLE